MNRLHIFNCSNDLALASNSQAYIPPKNILLMEKELSSLPIWWADDGDAVLLQEKEHIAKVQDIANRIGKKLFFTTPQEGYHSLCHRCACKGFVAAPWGWSKDIARRLLSYGVPKESVPDKERLEQLRGLSSKRYACEYIQAFLSHNAIKENRNLFVGEKMRYLQNIESLKITETTILKSPWSSSGRGVFSADSIESPSIREKLSGFINRQGGFIADKLYYKVLDFALEFSIEEGKAHFIGYSVFTAADNGYYGYNIVASQEELKQMILDSGIDELLLQQCIDLHTLFLEKEISHFYNGYLGIDMLVADVDGCRKIHPCVEINLRMNLGIASIFIYNATKGVECQLSPAVCKNFTAKIEDKKLILKQER